jgi:hypothetical protein
LLIIEVVTDVIDELFQHELSKLGVIIHQRLVSWFYGGGLQVYGDREIKEASEQTKKLEKTA